MVILKNFASPTLLGLPQKLLPPIASIGLILEKASEKLRN